MGFFQRLFGSQGPCGMCGRQASLLLVNFPDGTQLRICSTCKRQADKIFQDPLHDFEFGRIIDRFTPTSEGVAGVPWNTIRDTLHEHLPHDLSKGMSQGRSPNLARSNVLLERSSVNVTFVFGEEGISEVVIAPEKAVLDAVHPLNQRFGSPIEVPGMTPTELRLVWKGDGFEVDLTESSKKVVSVSFRKGYRWTE